MTNDYQPIACDLHSEFELLAMHGRINPSLSAKYIRPPRGAFCI